MLGSREAAGLATRFFGRTSSSFALSQLPPRTTLRSASVAAPAYADNTLTNIEDSNACTLAYAGAIASRTLPSFHPRISTEVIAGFGVDRIDRSAARMTIGAGSVAFWSPLPLLGAAFAPLLERAML